MKSRDLVTESLSSGPGRARWPVPCTEGWAFWPQWCLCADSAPALANLQATGIKSHEFISICVISELLNQNFHPPKDPSLRDVTAKRKRSFKCLCYRFVLSVHGPEGAGLSGDTGTVETLLLTKEGGFLNDCTFLCRRELSVFLTLYWRSLELCEEQFMKSQKCLYSQQEDCRKQRPQQWGNCHTHAPR